MVSELTQTELIGYRQFYVADLAVEILGKFACTHIVTEIKPEARLLAYAHTRKRSNVHTFKFAVFCVEVVGNICICCPVDNSKTFRLT